MTLVDTSVWVEHLRRRSPRLCALLLDDQVLCHPVIIGELACGHLHGRVLIDTARLHGLGLGWNDVHLVASVLVTRCNLWTLDKTLERGAASLKIRA